MVKTKDQRPKIKYLRLVAIWTIFVIIASLISISVLSDDLRTYANLKTSGIPAKGTVISKEPENHQVVRYSYQVAQQTYGGIGHGGNGNPSFDSLSVGDSLLIFYDPASPSVSCLGYPDHHFWSQVAGIVFLLVGLPLVGMFSLHHKGYLRQWHVMGN
jgi:Protein of unknown function (DUF3592)